MAKIPTGNFGYRTSQGGDVSPTASFDPSVGEAINRTGQVIANAGANFTAQAARQMEIERHEGKQAEERAQQAKTALAHVNIQNGLADSFDELQRNVLEGKTDKIAATAAWEETSRKVIDTQLAGLPADRGALVAAQGKGMEGKLRNSLFDTFRKRDDQEAIAAVGSAEEGLQRLATRDLNGAIAQHGMLIAGSPLAPEVKAARTQKFIETATFNSYRGATLMAAQSGSTAALDEVAKRVATDDRLDPARANQLSQMIFGVKTSIETKQERAANKAERDAEKQFKVATDTLNENRKIVMEAGILSPERIAETSQAVAGTGLEKDWQALMEAQKSANAFGSLPATQRAAVLADARAARADPAIGADPKSELQLKRAEAIQDNLTKGYEQDAWQTYSKVSGKAYPAINVGNANDAVAVLQQRMANIREVDSAAGFKVSPLQPPEVEQLGKMVRTLKPDQAASMLGKMGGVIGDAERIGQFAKQLSSKDSAPLGYAMMAANNGTDKGNLVATHILEGAQNIRDKVVKVEGEAETGWRSEISKQIRGAYNNPEIESAMIETAFLIRASGAYKVDNESAVNMATGGILADHNGTKLPLPYGVKEDAFEKRLAAITPATLSTQAPDGYVIVGNSKLPLAEFAASIPSARLIHAGQGLYNVRTGNNLVTNAQGRRITLNLGAP